METTAAALTTDVIVGVVGAGTMGRGIASVAAAAGHRVLMTDAVPGAIAEAKAELAGRMDRDVERGRLGRGAADARLARIQAAGELADLAEAGLVIEAIVEDLAVKHDVFGQLEAIVDADTILASNTSSLSITEIGAALARPGRVVGMHFFNPAPLLPLVEVVAAETSDPAVVECVRATAAAWGKTPVVCTSTPGFIVNRIARPFYLEPLRMLEEGAAPAQTDAAFTAAGFRMGPFALLDLIGLDVNLAVSVSVFRQLSNNPRIPPSSLQTEMVDTGRLGRKTSQGFYAYPEGAPSFDVVEPSGVTNVSVIGDLHHGGDLVDRLSAATKIESLPADDGPGRLVIDGHVVVATPVPVPPGGAAFDLVNDWTTTEAVAAAGAPQALAAFAGAMDLCGVAVVPIEGTPGLVVMRTVAMLCAVAEEAAMAGVASRPDIDMAMRLGLNYPAGPFEWSARITTETIDEVLRALHDHYGEDRYGPIKR